MQIRFQADADLNLSIVHATVRREPTIDFQTARVAHLAGRNDLDVLAVAADQERILVTHDQKTMPQIFASFISRQLSYGVLVVPLSTCRFPLSSTSFW